MDASRLLLKSSILQRNQIFQNSVPVAKIKKFGNFWVIWQIKTYLGNFTLIFIVVNGQISNKQSAHLVTMHSQSSYLLRRKTLNGLPRSTSRNKIVEKLLGVFVRFKVTARWWCLSEHFSTMASDRKGKYYLICLEECSGPILQNYTAQSDSFITSKFNLRRVRQWMVPAKLRPFSWI